MSNSNAFLIVVHEKKIFKYVYYIHLHVYNGPKVLRKQLELLIELYRSSLNGESVKMIQKINPEVRDRKKLPRGMTEWERTCQASGVLGLYFLLWG